MDMFNKGHLSERAFRELLLMLAVQTDEVRYKGASKQIGYQRLRRHRYAKVLFHLLDRLPGLGPLVERLRMARISMDYEQAWGHYQGSSRVLACLDESAQSGAIPTEIIEEVRSQYRSWNETAKRQLDQMAEQFPEFVIAMQEQLGRRLALLAEAETVKEHAIHGKLPGGVADSMQADISRKLWSLRSHEVSKLVGEPHELLRKVPLFRDIPSQEFAQIAARMRAHTFSERETIIRQGEAGDALFLIARGVVRVSRKVQGARRDIATLMTGDFFGEMALLHGKPRSATVLAVTPCSLYELRRKDLDASMGVYPTIRSMLEEADQRREEELTSTSNL